jgi:hypothetical protein
VLELGGLAQQVDELFLSWTTISADMAGMVGMVASIASFVAGLATRLDASRTEGAPIR